MVAVVVVVAVTAGAVVKAEADPATAPEGAVEGTLDTVAGCPKCTVAGADGTAEVCVTGTALVTTACVPNSGVLETPIDNKPAAVVGAPKPEVGAIVVANEPNRLPPAAAVLAAVNVPKFGALAVDVIPLNNPKVADFAVPGAVTDGKALAAVEAVGAAVVVA